MNGTKRKKKRSCVRKKSHPFEKFYSCAILGKERNENPLCSAPLIFLLYKINKKIINLHENKVNFYVNLRSIRKMM